MTRVPARGKVVASMQLRKNESWNRARWSRLAGCTLLRGSRNSDTLAVVGEAA